MDEQVRIVQRMNAQIAGAAEMQAAARAQLDEIERLPARLLAQTFETHELRTIANARN